MAKERNTQIPIEAIDEAASIRDEFDINVSVTQVCCDKNISKANKGNTKTVMSNPKQRTSGVFSTDLKNGISIKVEPNEVTTER